MSNTLTKKELLSIISKMSKKELLHIVNNKYGGNGNNSVVKTPIEFKQNISNKKNFIMKNDNQYNKKYINNQE